MAQARDCWHAVVNMVENLLPEKVGNFSTTCATISCSRGVAVCEGSIDPDICESCFRFYDPSFIYMRLPYRRVNCESTDERIVESYTKSADTWLVLLYNFVVFYRLQARIHLLIVLGVDYRIF